jgi:hypothetical protein
MERGNLAEEEIMDLRVTSTGKTFYEVHPTIAAILVEAFPAAFERIQHHAPDRQPVVMLPQPTWGIKKMPTSGVVAIQCDYGRETQYFIGKPEDAASFKVGHSTPPEEVIAAYRAQYKTAAGLANELEVNYERQRQARQQ